MDLESVFVFNILQIVCSPYPFYSIATLVIELLLHVFRAKKSALTLQSTV